MSFVLTGILQIAPTSIGKQPLGIIVIFLNNSLLKINTRSSLLGFFNSQETGYLIYCIQPEEVSSFPLNSDHKFYKYTPLA